MAAKPQNGRWRLKVASRQRVHVCKITVLSETKLTNISPVAEMKLCLYGIRVFLSKSGLPQIVFIRFDWSIFDPW